jgi:hypothetical protein
MLCYIAQKTAAAETSVSISGNISQTQHQATTVTEMTWLASLGHSSDFSI